MNTSIKAGVTEVVQRIVDQHGGITAAQLVKAARSKNSPAHNGFEWDDTVAGGQYRLIQARNWIRVVTVIHEDRKERLWHVPSSYDDDNEGNEGVYRTQPVLVTIPDEYERALAQAQSLLRATARAFEELRTAVDNHPTPDRSAIVAQMAKALGLMQQALDMVH